MAMRWGKKALATGTPGDPADERGRVFDWRRDRRIWIHLSAFLLFSVLIHGSGFYLFKVVYPTPVRVEPDPASITVMDPSVPAVRALLQRLSDRTVYLLPPSAQSEVRVSLESRRVRFTPSFQRAELDLLPPASAEAMPGAIAPLPLTSGATADVPIERGFAVRVAVKLDPALGHRAVAPWSLLRDYLEPAESLPLIRFSIAISPGGEVKVAAVEATLPDSEKAELAAVLESTLRFAPAATEDLGWIEIGGEG